MSTPSFSPPSSPLAHRRTPVKPDVRYPPSPPASAASSPCGPRKMSLVKGSTFHVSSSPPTEDCPVLSVPHLPKRSPYMLAVFTYQSPLREGRRRCTHNRGVRTHFLWCPGKVTSSPPACYQSHLPSRNRSPHKSILGRGAWLIRRHPD